MTNPSPLFWGKFWKTQHQIKVSDLISARRWVKAFDRQHVQLLPAAERLGLGGRLCA